MNYKNHAKLTIENLLPLELYALKVQLQETLGTRIRFSEEKNGHLTITLWRGEPLPSGGAAETAESYH